MLKKNVVVQVLGQPARPVRVAAVNEAGVVQSPSGSRRSRLASRARWRRRRRVRRWPWCGGGRVRSSEARDRRGLAAVVDEVVLDREGGELRVEVTLYVPDLC
eukprot:100092-Prorocentrum_minimum.AAC.1